MTITSLLCLVVWIVAGLATTSGGWNMESAQANPLSIHANPLLVTLPCVALATYMMAELNNANTLIRIYSRMVSCAFLVMMTMASFQYTSIGSAVVALCMAMFYTYRTRMWNETIAKQNETIIKLLNERSPGVADGIHEQ